MDSETFKDLGWVIEVKMKNQIHGYIPNTEFYINHYQEKNLTKIHTLDEILFKGTIKTKEELKTLMKQIGIK